MKRTFSRLVDLLLGVVEEGLEVREGLVVEHRLRLLVRAGHDVAHGPQRRRLHLHLPVGQQRHQLGHHAGVDHHLDLLVASVGEVAQRPDGID